MRELSLQEILGVSGAGALTPGEASGIDVRHAGVAIMGSAGTALAYSMASTVLQSFDPQMMVTAVTFGWLVPIIGDTHVIKQEQSVPARLSLSAALGSFSGLCGALTQNNRHETRH